MAEYTVTCIRKHPTHQDPRHAIEGIGGAAGLLGGWFHTADEAIRNIDAGDNYWVEVGGRRVRVIAVQRGLLRRHLTTEPDSDPVNNLLSLGECP